MCRRLLTMSAASVTAAFAGLFGLSSSTAWAGSNGQHIRYINSGSYQQCTIGRNQNGKSVEHCSALMNEGANEESGWWWVGKVGITWYRPDGSAVENVCDIPPAQNGDFVDCLEAAPHPGEDVPPPCPAKACLRPAPPAKCPQGQVYELVPPGYPACGTPEQNDENYPDVPE